MTTDVQVSVSEDLNHNTFILTSLPTYTLGCLACFLGEADPQDSRNINCSGHKFYVRTKWGRYFRKLLYLQVKIWNSPRFPV